MLANYTCGDYKHQKLFDYNNQVEEISLPTSMYNNNNSSSETLWEK